MCILIARLVIASVGAVPLVAIAQTNCSHAVIPIDAINRTKQLGQGVAPQVRSEDLIVKAGGTVGRVASLMPLTTHSATLVLDASGSMADKWKQIVVASTDLINRLPQNIELGMLVFSENINDSVPTGTVRSTLLQHIQALAAREPKGRTSLWDAIYLVAQTPGQFGDAVFVISDGSDNRSKTPPKRARDILSDAGIRLFAVIVRDAAATVEERAGPGQLGDLANATGGYALTIDNASELPYTLRSLVDQSLSYYSAELAFDISPRDRAKLSIEFSSPKQVPKRIELVYPHELPTCPTAVQQR